MALADIIQRIEQDAVAEAAALVAAAETESARRRTEATAEAESDYTAMLAKATHDAEDDARTQVAAARLRGRDRVLAEKRVLIERALDEAVALIEALDAAAYAALLANAVAKAARGDEVVSLGRVDAERLATEFQTALSAAKSGATLGAPDASFERGALLQGERMSVLISARSMVEVNRSEYEALVSDVLFGGDE